MDRELLLELGCEELPASWLPGLTNQIGKVVEEQLRAHRLPPEASAESLLVSTPSASMKSSGNRNIAASQPTNPQRSSLTT